ncbi:MAG TPA: BamA/TamA family outer membrane protein [Parachlamydiaceae bacterium]|nr:BamA/TamA family outer membrane protein [Parachlamydiaceae bacterium]
MFHKLYLNLLLSCFLFCFWQACAFDSYVIEFEGIQSEETLHVLKSASKLIALQDIPPISDASLKRRAEADIANLIKALHSLSFYGASVNLKIDFNKEPVVIHFFIDEGPLFFLGEFNLKNSKSKETGFLVDSISLEEIGIKLHEKAIPVTIINAEEALLNLLEKKGYPFSTIEKRDVVIDQEKELALVTLTIDTGSFCPFGNAHIFGNKRVSKEFIKKKLSWKKGDAFDPTKLELTQNALEQTGLFSSISIEKAAVQEEGFLPIDIYVKEAKQRSIGAGASYATERGIGAAFEWEHRNVRQMGEKLSLSANIWQATQEASLLYLIPDFKIPGRHLRLLLDYEHERTKGYSEIHYSTGALLSRQLSPKMNMSYGLLYKHLRDTRSDNNRGFNILKSPFQLRFSDMDSILDPTNGFSLNFKATPSVQLLEPRFCYSINTLTSTFYLPLTQDRRLVFAEKLTIGSIFGATHYDIPPSERFYAGSDTLLRGYHYLTVSPLNHDNKPIGGKSMLINSWELRYRTSKTLGFCFFYDAGNVYASYLPNFKEKLLQSIGIGIRYYTPVGPLRADLAFPLDRRKHLDSPFQFYFSIGQTF